MTTWFGNPGSTEIPLSADFPDNLHYVRAVHENAAVGMAAGYAIASGKAQMVSLHTTAGLGSAVSALATARVKRAPLVVLVGQQDHHHLDREPFLTGHVATLAGDYLVSVHQPVCAQGVPGAVARARHEAIGARGPSLVIVPMDNWGEETDDTVITAPLSLLTATSVQASDIAQLADLVEGSNRPVVVTSAAINVDGRFAKHRPRWRSPPSGVLNYGDSAASTGGVPCVWNDSMVFIPMPVPAPVPPGTGRPASSPAPAAAELRHCGARSDSPQAPRHTRPRPHAPDHDGASG
jgi:hypothetical protein